MVRNHVPHYSKFQYKNYIKDAKLLRTRLFKEMHESSNLHIVLIILWTMKSTEFEYKLFSYVVSSFSVISRCKLH